MKLSVNDFYIFQKIIPLRNTFCPSFLTELQKCSYGRRLLGCWKMLPFCFSNLFILVNFWLYFFLNTICKRQKLITLILLTNVYEIPHCGLVLIFIYCHWLDEKIQSVLVTYVLSFNIVISEWELQLCQHIHFWTYIVEKGMKSLFLSAMG